MVDRRFLEGLGCVQEDAVVLAGGWNIEGNGTFEGIDGEGGIWK